MLPGLPGSTFMATIKLRMMHTQPAKMQTALTLTISIHLSSVEQSSSSLYCPTWPVNPSATAAVSFGTASPNPHPPSLSCATIAPAHFPLLNPQHPDAQSASLPQTPVINCVPGAFPLPLVLVLPLAALAAVLVAGTAATTAAAALLPPPTCPVNPSATAAVSFGSASPCPQPPSRSCATIAPAHFPELKPQQPDAQSASFAQTPVMNCVPAAAETEEVAAGGEATVARVVGVGGAAAAVVPPPTWPVNPRATAAMSFGCALWSIGVSFCL